MGIGSFLFGGTRTVDTTDPTVRGMTEGIMSKNYDPGLGKAGHLGKSMLKAIEQGRYYDLPEVQLAIAQGQRGWKDLERRMQMGSAGMGMQPALLQGMLMKGQLQHQNQMGTQVIGAATQAGQLYSNMYNLARGQRIEADEAGDRLKLGAGELRQSGIRREQTQGFLSKLGQITSLFSPLGAGISALGGLGGGIGRNVTRPGTGPGF